MMNLEKFRAAEFERRTARVPVPALADFFDEGAPAELVVQGLTGPEVFEAERRREQNRNIDELVKMLASKNVKTRVSAAAESLGFTGDAHSTLVKAIAFVELGVVSDDLAQEDVVRMAEFHIDTVLALFKQINTLTGLGHVTVGKSNASGQTTASGTPSPSAPEAPEGSGSSSK